MVRISLENKPSHLQEGHDAGMSFTIVEVRFRQVPGHVKAQ
jgi:hypothetical protein